MTRRLFGRRRWVASLGLLTALLRPAPARPEPVMEYLYIEANEDGSSGGHVALRLGDQVFHFQHVPPGIVAVGRAGYRQFRHQYADLENRSIHASRIRVDEETYALLLERFLGRLVIQDRQMAALEDLRRDRDTTESVLGGTIPIEGAGFFFADGDAGPWVGAPDRAPPEGTAEPALVALRSRITAVRGPDFLAGRLDEAQRRLAALDPAAIELPAPISSEEEAPRPVYGFPRRYGDIAAALLALDVLGSARPLRETVTAADPGGPPLDRSEIDDVRRLSSALEQSLIRLIGSERPDWGPAALLGMARLVALRLSERAGRWIALDTFPAGAVGSRRLTARPDIMVAELGDAREAFELSRRRLLDATPASGPLPEIEFTAFEAALNRLIELRRGLMEERPVRGWIERLPDRPARLGLPRPIPPEVLTRVIDLLGSREAAYTRELERLYGYNVISRNCATEIFRELEIALAGASRRAGSTAGDADLPGEPPRPESPARQESVRRLGGYLPSSGSLNFVPVLSARAVRETYAITGVEDIPSYRRRRVARLEEQEGAGGQVLLRESNTLTSTIYRWNPRDSAFLFFTDDAVALRPLLGAANLLVGAGASIAGLVALPADRGEMLKAGLKGMLWSLPELVFQNVRKGSFEYARPAD